MSNLDKKPWLRYYEKGVPESLEYPDCSMIDLIIDQAERWPNNVAYSYYGHNVTYKSFIKKIEKTARALKNYGVNAGDRVTICMPNMPEGIIMVYAVNMIGAVCNMVHPLSSEKELEYYIRAAESKYVLVYDGVFEKIYKLRDTAKLERIIVVRPTTGMGFLKKKMAKLLRIRGNVKLPRGDDRVVLWEEFISRSFFYQGNYHEDCRADDDAVILYSGGTTGEPKGIVLSNLNFNGLGLMATGMIRQAVPGSTVLSILPIFHGFGLGVCIHTPLSKGMKCILIPAFSHKQFGKIIKKNQPNFIAGVPTLFEGLLSNKMKKDDLECVTSVICGGDALNQTLRDKLNVFLAEHGSRARVRVGYGLTEATGATCLSPEEVFDNGIIGAPFPDMDFKIVKVGTMREAKIGEEGEICISGPLIMKRYLNDEKETDNVVWTNKDGERWLHTGDIGYLGKDGLIYFTQRLKRIIVSSGYNIYPTYLEAIIGMHELVETSVVVGAPHKYKGQVPKAYIVLKKGVKPSKKIEKEIRMLLEKNVAIYALPVEYIFKDELPKTAVGKVAFKKLENESI